MAVCLDNARGLATETTVARAPGARMLGRDWTAAGDGP